MALAVGSTLMYNISEFEIESVDVFQSELDQCPKELNREINFNDLKQYSVAHTSLECGEDLKTAEISQRFSEQLLLELAEENEFYRGGDHLVHFYEDCDYPEGVIGLVVNNEMEDIVFESGEELEIHLEDEMVALCN